MTTAIERAYLGRIARMRCVVCQLLGREQETRTEVHHMREGVGMGQRQSHWLTIPLCSEDHRGPQGIHGDKTFLRILKMDELDLLSTTISILNATPAPSLVDAYL